MKWYNFHYSLVYEMLRGFSPLKRVGFILSVYKVIHFLKPLLKSHEILLIAQMTSQGEIKGIWPMSLLLGRKNSPPEPRGKDYVVECKIEARDSTILLCGNSCDYIQVTLAVKLLQ